MTIDLRKYLISEALKNQGGGILGNENQGGLFGNLANINPNLLIGASVLGAGLKGQDPFSPIMPSVFQAAQIKKALTPKDKRTSLMKNLEAAGFEPGTPEYENALKLRTLNEGSAPLSGLAQKANRDKSKISGDYAIQGLDKLVTVAKIGNRSPEVYGVGGAVKGLGKDILTEVRDTYQTTIDTSGEIDFEALKTLGNPDFSGISPIENALTIHIARNRNRSGRLLKDMISQAQQDAKLQGIGGFTKVKEKLPFLLDEFVTSARTSYRQAGLTEDEINKKIKPKVEEFMSIYESKPNVDKEKLSFNKKKKTKKILPDSADKDGIWRFK